MSNQYFKSKHFKVHCISNTGKTSVWILNKRGLEKAKLGDVKWKGAERKYCFFPKKDALISEPCMRDIEKFIAAEMSNYEQTRGFRFKKAEHE